MVSDPDGGDAEHDQRQDQVLEGPGVGVVAYQEQLSKAADRVSS